MRRRRDRSRAEARRFAAEGPEVLEGRALLATVTVNAGQVVRSVDTRLLGVNVTWWDSNLNTGPTKQLVQAAGLTSFRFPGGSSSDDFHFNSPPSYHGQGTDASMAAFVATVGGQGVVTLDYGSGSPQEAAAFLAYLNAPVGNTTALGTGPEWNDRTGTWVTVDWKTAGYWSSLRAAAPLAKDDGLNFLRLGRTAPFGFRFFEVGNEEYGTWEVDHHGQAGDPGKPHDPATYVAFAKAFATLAARIDPTVSIGLDVGDPYGFNNWTANVLKQSAARGFTPGFLSDHSYVQAPGSEGDSNLLLNTFSNPKSVDDWVVRGADYKALIGQYLGAAGRNVELLATEFNSVYSNPGKQTTSLVNGLSVADSLGVLLTSPYNGANVWDLRNGWDTSNNNAATLYGWRHGGDYGLIGSPNGAPPATGAYVPYPTYFAEQLASKIVRSGGRVVQASSSDPNLTAYAVLEANGHLDLLVVNKSAAGPVTGTFQINGFRPAARAQVWQYGEAQDTAQSRTTDGHSALASFTVTLALTGSTFRYSFPAYSMTVLDLGAATARRAASPTAAVGVPAASAVAAAPAPVPTVGAARTAANPPAPVFGLAAQSPAARRPPVFDRKRG